MENKKVFIDKFKCEYTKDVIKLWNECCNENFIYKPMDLRTFRQIFIDSPYFSLDSTFVCICDKQIIGFINGVNRKEFLLDKIDDLKTGYITMIIVKENFRRMSYGKALVNNLENYFIGQGKKFIRIDFFNPINIPWYIPNSSIHDHPNAPGVDVNGDGYKFFKSIGYRERTKEVSMYRVLRNFKINEKIKMKQERLKNKNIFIEAYNSDKHSGLDELFDSLGNELWRREIKEHLKKENSTPILVAIDGNSVCGFAGPIDIERSGRGRFSGIGVKKDYMGNGIGKVLFFNLCENFKNEGAKFMSLFTSINGNAKYIYDYAGFTEVRQWALFEKEV
ncbi:GNAT family N-acetyltransferase [Clostridium rectalis]|uniref:GNAT family N-acetyltransferase n=1 Tax=Clostridium rectalis TaxID=2040295 RepID=UPI0013DE420B|nr:GNAT family N-acetyltransferase [Clostridium rectalis]